VNQGCSVRGFDLVATPNLASSIVGSISAIDDVRKAMAQVDVLIHLAATPDDDDFHSQLLPNNIIGTYNIIEAAREANVKRVMLASTGQVVWWQRMRNEIPIGVDVQPTPRGWYATTKCFMEAAGRSLAESQKRDVLAVRLGWCPRSREQVQEMLTSQWARDVYLSPADAGRFFAAAVSCPGWGGYRVVYACSKPERNETYDLEPTQRLTGYVAQDVWPVGVEGMM
jgi:nucleoside-diphosphate-sugar epimerase